MTTKRMLTIVLSILVGTLFYLAVRLEAGRIYVEHQRQAKELELLREQFAATMANDHSTAMRLTRENEILRKHVTGYWKGEDPTKKP